MDDEALALQPVSLGNLLRYVILDLFAIGVVIRQGGVDLRQHQVLDSIRDLLRRHAQLGTDTWLERVLDADQLEDVLH